MSETTNDTATRRSWFSFSFPYLRELLVNVLIFLLFYFVWRDLMAPALSQLSYGLDWHGVARAWPLFAWAVGISLFALAFGERLETSWGRSSHILRGIWVSLNIGILEELIYRVFLFLNAMVILTFLNFITFGFVGWVFTKLVTPVANFLTLHALEVQLINGNWLLGAAIGAASIEYLRVGPKRGWFHQLTTWPIGMLMFWLVFNYGLLTAIVVHVLYYVVIYVFESARIRTRVVFTYGGVTLEA